MQNEFFSQKPPKMVILFFFLNDLELLKEQEETLEKTKMKENFSSSGWYDLAAPLVTSVLFFWNYTLSRTIESPLTGSSL